MEMSIDIVRKYKHAFTSRNAEVTDRESIVDLYKSVSRIPGGIARVESEISNSYVDRFIQKSRINGIQRVVENPLDKNQLIAEIHCHKLESGVFNHILSELTIVVHPDFQNKGIGKLIFSDLLNVVSATRKDILRVELIVRESNTRAIGLYQSLGFIAEGRLEKRIQSPDGRFEADIPMYWLNKNYEL
jgi:ribosomal protein S18 acetylase RimI-like enzyme